MEGKDHFTKIDRASLVAQMVKNLPAVLETQVWSLGREDTLEKGMVIHSSIFAWGIPCTEEPVSPWGCKGSPRGRKESDTTEWLTLSFSLRRTTHLRSAEQSVIGFRLFKNRRSWNPRTGTDVYLWDSPKLSQAQLVTWRPRVLRQCPDPLHRKNTRRTCHLSTPWLYSGFLLTLQKAIK